MSLKYFCDADIHYNIVCAGSLLGVALNRFQSSFPIGGMPASIMEDIRVESDMLSYADLIGQNINIFKGMLTENYIAQSFKANQ